MRRNYISPEFEYRKVFGTLNMKEESTFFGSKMLEIEDIIELHNQGIIYYQNSNNEQIDLDIERSLNPIVYSASDDKKNNHTLVIDESQSDPQRNNLTKKPNIFNLFHLMLVFTVKKWLIMYIFHFRYIVYMFII